MVERGVVTRKATRSDMRTVVELSAALFQEDAGQRDSFMNLEWPRLEGEEIYTAMSGLVMWTWMRERRPSQVRRMSGSARRRSK
jgi:hypothetical protein